MASIRTLSIGRQQDIGLIRMRVIVTAEIVHVTSEGDGVTVAGQSDTS